MTKQYPPGYTDPGWDPPQWIKDLPDHVRPKFTENALKIAGDLMELILLEIEEGDSSELYRELTAAERAAVWFALGDACNDTTED